MQQSTSSKEGDHDKKKESESENVHGLASISHFILESFPMSPDSKSSSSELSNLSFDYTPAVNEMNWFPNEGMASTNTFAESSDWLWTEPLWTDDSYTQYCCPPINDSPLFQSFCSDDTDMFLYIYDEISYFA